MRNNLFILILIYGGAVIGLGQNPFMATNSQVMEWNDPSYYHLSQNTSALGIVYQSQFQNKTADLFKSYAIYGHHVFSTNQKDAFGLQMQATFDQDQGLTESIQIISGVSYQKSFTDSRQPWQHKAGVGFQGGLSKTSMNFENYWFTNQFDISTERIQFGWDSGEAIPEGQLSSNTYFPIHGGLHYQAESDNITFAVVLAARNLNEPIARFEGMTHRFSRGYFGHIQSEIKVKNNMAWKPWLSFGKQDLSEVFQVGNSWSLKGDAYQDWNMSLSAFCIWTPRIDHYTVSQLGTSFRLEWNEIGFMMQYLFPLQSVDNLGNTFQLGLYFIPKIEKALRY